MAAISIRGVGALSGLREGSTGELWLDLSKLPRFDPDTGERLQS